MPPMDTQTVYHAVGKTVADRDSPPTIIICWPAEDDPHGLACIGYHQDIERDLNLDFCQREHVPIVRRILGGGAVYLDSSQIFYQIMAPRSILPSNTGEIFEFLLRAPVKTYRDIGVDAVFAPINDIRTTAGQKISGNGMGFVKDVAVVTGNLIEDFPYEKMGQVLNVPDEKFRDKAIQTMRQYIGTIKTLVENPPPRPQIVKLLVENFGAELGIDLFPGELTDREEKIMKRLGAKYQSHEWLYMTQFHPIPVPGGHKLKISADVHLYQADYKSPGGLIRVNLVERAGAIYDINITGDFHLTPRKALFHLMETLRGLGLSEDVLTPVIEEFYEVHGVESPGTQPSDLTTAILRAVQV